MEHPHARADHVAREGRGHTLDAAAPVGAHAVGIDEPMSVVVPPMSIDSRWPKP